MFLRRKKRKNKTIGQVLGQCFTNFSVKTVKIVLISYSFVQKKRIYFSRRQTEKQELF